MALQTVITDHCSIMCYTDEFRFPNFQKQKKQQTFFRDKSKFDQNEFSNDLKSTLNNFIVNSSALSPVNFNDTFNQFFNILLFSINLHAPLKPISREQKH